MHEQVRRSPKQHGQGVQLRQINKNKKIKRIIEQYNMLPYRNNRDNNQSTKRKTKEGDWVCIRCNNYNYSFRHVCNRCRAQSKDDNHTTYAMLTNENYGENSFPSALFLKLDPLKVRDHTFPTMKETAEKSDRVEKLDRQDEGLALKENQWINNLIDD